MTRAAIYARYSTELQRDASIEDQVRLCKRRIEAEKWSLVATYTDHAISGTIRMRPGYQKLLEDVRASRFDVVIAEALDRLSRDQEDIAALYKHLAFAGVLLVTLSEGTITELHVGLKGTMNALFLKDLAQKVRRGLEGRVRQGRSGGGLAYGYRVALRLDERGAVVRGDRAIDQSEAAAIVRIFEAFAAGKSPRSIASELNVEGVPGHSGRPWTDTTIRGHGKRGCGILRNEIYIGRLIWNRQYFLKDPTTGRRVTRLKPRSEWVVADVPHLRIVPQDLWDRVQGRLQLLRSRPSTQKALENRFWERRRPKHLLTGLVKCADCGGDYASSGRHYLSCSSARRKGTCNNRKGVPRNVLEELILNALKERLMAPEFVKGFVRAFHAELNRQRLDAELVAGTKRRELDGITRKLDNVVDAIAEGFRAPGLQQRLDELSRRKVELEAALDSGATPLPRLHPNLAELYRRKVERLHDALKDEATREEALEILRSLIEKVIVRHGERGFEIELVGEIANMVALPLKAGCSKDQFRRSVKVVAGEGLEPPTLGL